MCIYIYIKLREKHYRRFPWNPFTGIKTTRQNSLGTLYHPSPHRHLLHAISSSSSGPLSRSLSLSFSLFFSLTIILSLSRVPNTHHHRRHHRRDLEGEFSLFIMCFYLPWIRSIYDDDTARWRVCVSPLPGGIRTRTYVKYIRYYNSQAFFPLFFPFLFLKVFYFECQ